MKLFVVVDFVFKLINCHGSNEKTEVH